MKRFLAPELVFSFAICLLLIKLIIFNRHSDGSFLLKRGNHHNHPLAFQHRHCLCTSVGLEFNCKTQKLFLALVLEHNRASAKEDRGLDLRAFLQELLGVLELELEVVLIGIGAEAYLLDDYLGRIDLHFLGLLLLLIDELLVVQNLAYRGIRLGTDLDKVEFQAVGKLESLRNGIYTLLGNIVSDKAYLRSCNLLIYPQFVLVFLLLARIETAVLGSCSRGFGFERCCDSCALLIKLYFYDNSSAIVALMYLIKSSTDIEP